MGTQGRHHRGCEISGGPGESWTAQLVLAEKRGCGGGPIMIEAYPEESLPRVRLEGQTDVLGLLPLCSFMRDLGDGYRIPSWLMLPHHCCALAHTHVFLSLPHRRMGLGEACGALGF